MILLRELRELRGQILHELRGQILHITYKT